jgi:hypothetical protein
MTPRWAFLVFLPLLGLTGGCGAGTGDLSGRVTFEGKPVLIGGLVFYNPGHRALSAGLGEDGTYTINNVPCGEVQIAVMSPRPVTRHGKRGEPPVEDPRLHQWFELPKRYENTETSGITFTVKPGANSFNIELVP